jgi:formate-dependent nitrite reductase membrane component NrfD
VRLPEFFKWIALAMAAAYFVIWSFGGLVYTSLPNAALGGNDTRVYFFIGWLILLSYLPLYWYRKKVEDPKLAGEMADATAPAAGD